MEFLIFIIITALGFYFGKRAEKKHYASIIKREEQYKNIVMLTDKDIRRIKNAHGEGVLFSAGTVIAIDAFKKLMAAFVNFFGGKIKSYESLVDRARREAVLKVKQQAAAQGYNALVNLRIETSSISKGTKNTVGAVESMAYASAIKIVNPGK